HGDLQGTQPIELRHGKVRKNQLRAMFLQRPDEGWFASHALHFAVELRALQAAQDQLRIGGGILDHDQSDRLSRHAITPQSGPGPPVCPVRSAAIRGCREGWESAPSIVAAPAMLGADSGSAKEKLAPASGAACAQMRPP